MAQGLLTLVSLCLVMAAASFLAGILPLALNLSSSRLRLVSTIGMGVLVGTSLIIIIPEGVDTLYSSSEASHANGRRSVTVSHAAVEWSHGPMLGDMGMYTPRSDSQALDMPGPVVPDSNTFPPPPPKTPTEPGAIGIMDTATKDEEVHEEAHHAWIGVALIAGFILMFLIDKVPQYSTKPKPQNHTRHISLTSLGRRFNLTTLDRQEEAETFIDSTQSAPHQPPERSSATTIGLVIHAAADGIALGASSSTSKTNLSLIIFFAIMVHKAPAAFGLTSVLLKQGLSKRMVRTHLVIFSLAAPAGAFLTWLLVRIVGGASETSPRDSTWWTGILLLFSAGTFLYVAMHSMQEITSIKHHETHMNGTTNGSIHETREAMGQEEKPSISDLGAAVFGMILPLFLQVGHAH